eukprot:7583830-Pyramimonas_sp.AAC.1
MCGAASSHTRGGDHDFICDPHCPCCGEAFWPSVRHCDTECAAFADFREQLTEFYSVPVSWWTSQPRVTSSSGWITYGAHRVAERRTELMAMQVRMEMYYVRQPKECDDLIDRMRGADSYREISLLLKSCALNANVERILIDLDIMYAGI